MEALDFDLADLDVPRVRGDKALALREQLGEVVPLRPDAWDDGYECGTLLDDTQPSPLDDTHIDDVIQPEGASGPDFVALTSANQDDDVPSPSHNEDLHGDTPIEGDDLLDVEEEDDHHVSSIGEKRQGEMLTCSSSKHQRVSTIPLRLESLVRLT